MKNGRIIILSILSLIVLICSCGDPYSVDSRSINFLDDGNGFRRFYADVPGYYGHGFFYYSYSSEQAPMDTVETQVKKISGSSNAGYGIVFCLQNNKNYYRLLIRTDGSYYVRKRVDGSLSTVISSNVSDALNVGYDTINHIKVAYDDATSVFTIYFNGILETSFNDTSFSSGYSGFYAMIGQVDQENFPDEPVDVRFKQIQPVNDP
jgi:hypothetical protein